MQHIYYIPVGTAIVAPDSSSCIMELQSLLLNETTKNNVGNKYNMIINWNFNLYFVYDC